MATPIVSDRTTRGIRAGATAFFLEDESTPCEMEGQPPQYVWGYRVLIVNNGDEPVQLTGRRWLIIDGEGKRQEISGSGVMGQKPTLKPGQAFRYVSSCPLTTHWGTMEGSLTARLEDGAEFDVEIGRFYLTSEPRVNVPMVA